MPIRLRPPGGLGASRTDVVIAANPMPNRACPVAASLTAGPVRVVVCILAVLATGACTIGPSSSLSPDLVSARRQEAEASGPKDGMYVSLAGLASTVSGDFDGTTFVVGGGSAEVMPELDTGDVPGPPRDPASNLGPVRAAPYLLREQAPSEIAATTDTSTCRVHPSGRRERHLDLPVPRHNFLSFTLSFHLAPICESHHE